MTEISKQEPHIVVELIEYVPKSIVSKTILKKTTGNITAVAVAIGATIAEQTIPFDTSIQIIDGAAEVIINEKKYQLKSGNGIIIPAHSKHSFNANEQFKMISTIIKSEYEI